MVILKWSDNLLTLYTVMLCKPKHNQYRVYIRVSMTIIALLDYEFSRK